MLSAELGKEGQCQRIYSEAENEQKRPPMRSTAMLYQKQYNLPKFEDSFNISTASVKKQERVMRSVLKLDENFHIYIHGNQELIEHGYDEEKGKKFYKVYFEEET